MFEPLGVANTYAMRMAGTASTLVRWAFLEFDLERVDGGRIRMVGVVKDEAALHGVLHRLQNLGLQIVEVHLIGQHERT